MDFDNLKETIENLSHENTANYIKDINENTFIIEINKIKELQDKFNIDNAVLSSLFGRDSTAENVFLNHFYSIRDTAIRYLATIYGDNEDWIFWYFDEVLNSTDSLDVIIDGITITCNTANDLYKIIKSRG